MSEEKKDIELNPRQELFSQLYATDREFFGNGVQAYIEAYDPDQSKPNWYKSACSAASRLLSNVKVIERINTLLEEGGLNDAFVDKQLKFLITQHSDFSSKIAAIREYNKLKKRVTNKLDLTSNGKQLVGFNYLPPAEPYGSDNSDYQATNDRELPAPIYGGKAYESKTYLNKYFHLL